MTKWFISHWRLISLSVVLASVLTPFFVSFYVKTITSSRRFTQPDQVPSEPVAIVFGAGVWADGTPTPMLADRVDGAVELYRLGRVSRILMTGDNSTPEYNEVVAMQEYAEKLGVPRQHIRLDYAGFSTYESCYRAKVIFGVERAVLITQKYHLPRAVYTCNQLGVNSVGLGTPDWGKYQDDSMRFYTQREVLAVLKAILELHLIRPKPTFLGPFEGMS